MIRYRIAAALLLLFGASSLLAQSEPELTHHIVRNEPYTATRRITTEDVQTGAAPVTHVLIRWEARSSQGFEWSKSPVEIKGVERTEQDQIKGSGPMNYVVWDPVKHRRIEWCSCGGKAIVTAFTPAAEPDRPVQATLTMLVGQLKDASPFTLTELPSRSVLYVQAEGMRATRALEPATPAPDPAAPTAALTAGIEVWYSPALHLNLSTVVFDARSGATGNSVITLARSDPDAQLFVIPSQFSRLMAETKAPAEKRMKQAKSAPAARPRQVASLAAEPVPLNADPPSGTNVPAATAGPMPAPTHAAAPTSAFAGTPGAALKATPSAQTTGSSSPDSAPFKPLPRFTAAPIHRAATPAAAVTPADPAVADLIARSRLQPIPARPAKPDKPGKAPKIYKNAPPGWPAGLPPL